MSAVLQKLRDSARDHTCVRCHNNDGTTVLAHYYGVRRHDYGGGLGIKGHDVIAAHLCGACHHYMDTLAKDKEGRWGTSEEFLHYCALTFIRWIQEGTLR